VFVPVLPEAIEHVTVATARSHDVVAKGQFDSAQLDGFQIGDVGQLVPCRRQTDLGSVISGQVRRRGAGIPAQENHMPARSIRFDPSSVPSLVETQESPFFLGERSFVEGGRLRGPFHGPSRARRLIRLMNAVPCFDACFRHDNPNRKRPGKPARSLRSFKWSERGIAGRMSCAKGGTFDFCMIIRGTSPFDELCSTLTRRVSALMIRV